MKRSPLRRKTPLKAKKGLERSQKPLESRTPLRSQSGLARTGGLSQRRTPPLVAPDEAIRRGGWHDAVIRGAPRQQKGQAVCPVCRKPPSRKNPLEAHHVVSQQSIRRYVAGLGLVRVQAVERLSALLWDVRNGLAVCRRCHDLHTRAKQRIPRAVLNDDHVAFAAEIGLGRLLDRYYQ